MGLFGGKESAYGMSEGVTGSDGGGGRLMRVGVEIILCSLWVPRLLCWLNSTSGFAAGNK